MKLILICVLILVSQVATARAANIHPRQLDYRDAMQLLDASAGESRLDKLAGLFHAEPTCAPPPEELEGIWVGTEFVDANHPATRIMLLVAKDPDRKRWEQPCANGCAYDDLRSVSWSAVGLGVLPTSEELTGAYETFWRGWRIQRNNGLHVNGVSDYWSTNGSVPGPGDTTGSEPESPFLRLGLVEKLRRSGPFLIAAHVNEAKFHHYALFFRRYPLPPRPSSALHFTGFGR